MLQINTVNNTDLFLGLKLPLIIHCMLSAFQASNVKPGGRAHTLQLLSKSSLHSASPPQAPPFSGKPTGMANR